MINIHDKIDLDKTISLLRRLDALDRNPDTHLRAELQREIRDALILYERQQKEPK